MPDRRTDAPASFGAPLDQLLPRLEGEAEVKLQVRRARRDRPARTSVPSDECPVFLLNQSLYERAENEG